MNPRKRITALALSALTLLGGAGLAAAAETATPAPAAAATTWTRDYADDFSGSLSSSRWGRYGYGYQPVGNGAMGTYSPDNVYASDGTMKLRTIYRNGAWTSAGVSGNPGFSAVGGKWEVRAKMPYAKGIGYVFLLMPADGSWPPELNIAEGRVNGRVESFYHWGNPSDHRQAYSINSNVNTHEWHTYGAIMDAANSRIIFTIDGDTVTGVINNVPVTGRKMWLGMQTGAMDPNGSAKAYETVDGGVPNSLTPASSEIQIDWIAHYRR
jgi:beta-glucanase (GH16 family)